MIRVTRRDDHYPNGTAPRHVVHGSADELERLHRTNLCWRPFHGVYYSVANVRGFGPVEGRSREEEIEATLAAVLDPVHGAGVDPVCRFLLSHYGAPKGGAL